MLDMVQLLVRLVVPPERVPDVLYPFSTVMRLAQQARGCRFAQVYNWMNDRQQIVYVEEWDDPTQLRGQFGSALGSRRAGTMRSLGLGTGLGSAQVVRGPIVPMELDGVVLG